MKMVEKTNSLIIKVSCEMDCPNCSKQTKVDFKGVPIGKQEGNCENCGKEIKININKELGQTLKEYSEYINKDKKVNYEN